MPGELTLALTEHQVPRRARGVRAAPRATGSPVELLDAAQARARVDSPRYLAGMYRPRRRARRPRPARLGAGAGGRVARRPAPRAHARHGVRHARAAACGCAPSGGSIHAGRVVIGTNASRGRAQAPQRLGAAGLRPRAHDRAADAGPARRDRLARTRGPHRRRQPVPLLPKDARRPGALRRLRRQLPLPRHASTPRSSSRTPRTACSPTTSSTSSRSSTGIRFTHRWAGVIDTTSRFTPVFGTALGGRMAYAVGYTGLGVASTRFGAAVALDLVDGRDTERDPARHGAAQADALPSRADPVCRRAGDAVGARRRGPHRAAQPVARGLDRLGVGFDS